MLAKGRHVLTAGRGLTFHYPFSYLLALIELFPDAGAL
jgi:hypothetical protein